MEEQNSEIVAEFVVEAEEHLRDIEAELLQIEEGGADLDLDLVNKVFRAIHSIKGVAGFLDLTSIGDLAHSLESVLDQIRKGELLPSSCTVDIMLGAADMLTQMVGDVGASNDVDVSAHLVSLGKILAADVQSVEAPVAAAPSSVAAENNVVEASPDATDAPTTSEKPENSETGEAPDLTEADVLDVARARALVVSNHGIWKIALPLESMAANLDQTLVELPEIVAGLGEILSGGKALIAACTQGEITDQQSPVTVIIATISQRNEICARLAIDSCALEYLEMEAAETSEVDAPAELPMPPVDEVAPASTQKAAKPAAKSSKASVGKPKIDNNIRVSVRLLDQLMNLAGELVLSRNQLSQSVTSGKQETLEAAVGRIDNVTSELQEAVMQTRMQPIGNVFAKFPRVVRDLSKQLGKTCTLTMEGKDVDLDKTLIEAVSDPLTHLVRNAVDHGMDLPEERARSGKNPEGSIVLRAYHQGGKVNISISDDGNGISPEKLKANAVAKGVLSQTEVDALSDREAINLIFAPGFSTAEKVTDVSGRGVGMDVVRSNLESIGGTVEIESEMGKGTTVTVKIPLTLAILAAMVVSCHGQRFAIPQANIRELVRIRSAEIPTRIERVHGHEVLRLRGKLLPIARLERVLNFADDTLEGETEQDPNILVPQARAINVVVVESGAYQYGIVVDSELDVEEIVVKPLGRHLRGSQEFSGATILGDGSIALILDINGIAIQTSIRTEDLHEGEGDGFETAKVAEEIEDLVLFNTSSEDAFAVPAVLVRRIERVRRDDIIQVGKSSAFDCGGEALPLLKLQDYMTTRPLVDQDAYSILVVNISGKDVGFLTSSLQDIRAFTLELDTKTFVEPGVFGSFQLDGQTVRLVNVGDIVERAYPQWFDEDKKANEAVAEAAPPKVLLVEDSAFFRKQIVTFIESAGFDSVDCEDGQYAWERLESQQEEFDIVITDLEMPRVDGFELTRMIKNDPRFQHLPVIALSSLSSKEDLIKGKRAGLDGHQVKLDKQALLKGIREFLGTKV